MYENFEFILSKCYPNSTEVNRELFSQPILACFQRYDITTLLRQVHFLAQIGHESAELRYREELASGAAYEGRRDLGNVRPGDGRKHKGYGLIQVTGYSNQTDYGRYIGRLDEIIANPKIIAEDPFLSVDVAGWYWLTRRLNRFADKDDLRGATRAINGGYNGLSDRARLLALCKAVFVQAALKHLGADLVIDGVYGPVTRKAVIDFQRKEGLTVDGVVGVQTWGALDQFVKV